MNLDQYQQALAKLPFGKRLPGAIYVYRDAGVSLGEELDRLVAQVGIAFQVGTEFNVVKFRTEELKVSWLAYPDFLADPHPALRHAVTIDLVRGQARHTDYTGNLNPPILHRKEAFLPDGHPKQKLFAALTAAEEAEGLYAHPATIGFKLNWERLLTAKGLRYVGHRLLHTATRTPKETNPGSPLPEPTRLSTGSAPRSTTSKRGQETHTDNGDSNVVVARHKTAMVRYELSKPVRTLLEYGQLKKDSTVFDYGCGQGADVTGLCNLGYAAAGWDPVHRPHEARRAAEVVNLGYVLNVIEDPAERLETLVDAFRHAQRLLVVAALIHETVDTGSARRYADGVLTRANTFQKFFEQQELQQYVEDALETTAVPVGLGIFYVFRDPVET